MTKLEDLKQGVLVRGIHTDGPVMVTHVKWYDTRAVDLTYRDSQGRDDSRILYRSDEARLEIVSQAPTWSFDADGYLLRLAAEAQRIRLAHLSDPYLAIHTSEVEPLPHQITAVYEQMLPRQPLRFLLADDPGAGKTIMAGLLIKEMLIRGDIERCLVICPGNLVEQWQDELYRRFSLDFAILTRQDIENTPTGNPFDKLHLVIARLDQLARNEDLQDKLAQHDWDFIVADEAHKMSASFFRGEINRTQRYRLGERLDAITRHLLLMTATPHNGKEEDFQLFMRLLDRDRFEGRFRDGVHTVNVNDIMRRMVKENILTFDARPLFPERRAYTLPYRLSPREKELYEAVTEYVREEFNRAEMLANGGRRGTVGFALTILQRRLASSPEAIYRSLQRRRTRLENRLVENRRAIFTQADAGELTDEDWDYLEDDAPAEETEQRQDAVVDLATAAQTEQELRIEIAHLKRLEVLAHEVRLSNTDHKWDELSLLLQDKTAMFDQVGVRRKLIIFTEHRDTLDYLTGRIRALLGKPEAVVNIHGGMRREDRRAVELAFTQDKDVSILVATDAAGEGINLQRAHLMINYDLPWNPNRLEQRFGRIHRIGQTEVCHLWNLLSEETREGDVYLTLLRKLERERESLGGAVFDVLGQAINGKQLRELLIEAIRYGDQPHVRARLHRQVEGALDTERLRNLREQNALAQEIMDVDRVHAIRHEKERIEARRLQPHHVSTFFKAAFEHLGGALHEREKDRYEITRVPREIRHHAQAMGLGRRVVERYERICFEKDLRRVPGKPMADFVCPGHPLLDTAIDLVLKRYRSLLKLGAVLVDDHDLGEESRVLFFMEHAVRNGSGREISQRLQFVEATLPRNGETGAGSGGPALAVRDAGPAPYLNYRPLKPDEQAQVSPIVADTLAGRDLDEAAHTHAVLYLAPEHLHETRAFHEPLLDRTYAAVKERLTKEIIHWDNQATRLAAEERMGKVNAKLNSRLARQRRDEIKARLDSRLHALETEKQITAAAPNIIGGALVIPRGLLERVQGRRATAAVVIELENKRVEMIAMHAVMAAEQALGFACTPIHRRKMGYDLESIAPDGSGSLRMLEVKGFTPGSNSVTVTRNEILTAVSKPDAWVLALVQIPDLERLSGGQEDSGLSGDALEEMLLSGQIAHELAAQCRVCYVRNFFKDPPDHRSTGSIYPWRELWGAGVDLSN